MDTEPVDVFSESWNIIIKIGHSRSRNDAIGNDKDFITIWTGWKINFWTKMVLKMQQMVLKILVLKKHGSIFKYHNPVYVPWNVLIDSKSNNNNNKI